MAITTLQGVISGLQPPIEIIKNGGATVAGRMYSTFYNAGNPAAASVSASGVAGAALTTYAGQITFNNAVGNASTYLARFSAGCNVQGTLLLCDRLWHNNGITVTDITAQVINSVAFPARDINQSISGESIMIGMEVTTVMGAGTPTLSLGYTSSTGVATTATTAAMVTTLPVNSFIPIPLTSGHTGVQSIQNWQQSATMTSGAYSLVAYRVLARLDIATNNMTYAIDALTSGFTMIHPNSVPFLLWVPTAATAPTITAQIVYAQG